MFSGCWKYSTGWRPPICVCKSQTGLWRPYLTIKVAFFATKKNTPFHMAGARNFFLSDPKISFFGPRRGFLPTFGCFQNILSLLSNSVNLVARCRSQIVQTLLSLPSNSVNLEGPLLEPARSHPIKSIIKEALRIY